MLREFGTSKSQDMAEINKILLKFDLPSSALTSGFGLLRYECISPDSFMWRITNGLNVYYLYAEDYIPGLGHVRQTFSAYLESDNWELIQVKDSGSFSEANPVIRANTYQEPENSSELMKYALDSGIDFAFLALSSEKVGESIFSSNAPRGFQS